MTADEITPPDIETDFIKPVLYPWQNDVWQRLVQQADQKHLPHALLLKGVEGSGLQAFALLLVNFLLCLSPKNDQPCGECRDCHLLSVGTHPGFSIIKPELSKKTESMSKVITIGQIRDVIDNMVNQTSLNARRKIVMISPADVLHHNAANTLLKSLEEPPPDTFFVLVSQKPARLLATIRSRCQIINLPSPQSADADSWLASRIADTGQRKLLLALSGNNPLLVLHWQENGDVASILQLAKELQQLLLGEVSALQLAAAWHKSDVLRRVVWWWRWLALELKLAARESAAQASSVATQQLLLFMQKLQTAKLQLESSANPNEQLLLESLLIDWRQLSSTGFHFALMTKKL
jgi:DNA polymerase-3 subunit delta'